MKDFLPRPRNARQAVVLLVAALVLFVGAIVAGREHNVLAIPLLVAGVPFAVIGARKPSV